MKVLTFFLAVRGDAHGMQVKLNKPRHRFEIKQLNFDRQIIGY